jgi:hypothetical protein
MRRHEMRRGWTVMVLVVAGLGGCITVPDVVLVENKTALEKQAAGEFRSLETQLQGAGIKGGPEHITVSQLNQKKVDLRESTLGEIVRLYSAVQSDTERVDHYLVAQCIGEARNGLLVETRDRCTEDIDPVEVTALLERSNRNRRQIWRDVIAKVKPGSKEEKVIQSWRQRHLQRVVCEGLIEGEEGWEIRKCED